MPQIIHIQDLSHPGLAPYVRLTEAQLRSRQDPKQALFIAESTRVIEHALDSGCEPVSMLMEEKHIYGQAADILKRCGDVPVYTGPSELLANLTGYQLHRGILCAMRRPEEAAPAAVLENARRVAVIEGVVDPTNIGAIFRSAAALNVDAVLLTPACSDPLYRRAIRVSMGTVFQVPWTFCDDINKVRSMGFQTVAMALRDDSVSLDDPKLMAEEKLAIILGTEGDGLANQTITESDYTVRIPMSHGVDSLNVAAASAVAFWQLCCVGGA